MGTGDGRAYEERVEGNAWKETLLKGIQVRQNDRGRDRKLK